MPDRRTATLASLSCAQPPGPPPRLLIRLRQRLAPSGLDRQCRPAHIGQHHFPHSAAPPHTQPPRQSNACCALAPPTARPAPASRHAAPSKVPGIALQAPSAPSPSGELLLLWVSSRS